MRAGAAFVAGLVLGAAAAWVAATRLTDVTGPPPAAGPAAPPRGVTAASPAPPGPPSEAATEQESRSTPNPWARPGPEAPLGTSASSPVPGDSTDALLTPRSLAAPADAPHLPSVSDLERLRARSLILPVEGYDLRRLPDNFAEKRGSRVHEAIDLAAPRGTPVLAVDEGVVRKLFTSAAGGLTVYQFDPGATYAYYYAHLDRYAEGLREGQAVRKGERLGYVGTSGNAPEETPHLHFTIFKLGPAKRWWEGIPINPYPLWALPR